VIFCCGETLEEREAGHQNEVVKAELDGSVFNLSAEEWKNIVLAYEPIGPSVPARPLPLTRLRRCWLTSLDRCRQIWQGGC
jgi:triosephosphate isomerase